MQEILKLFTSLTNIKANNYTIIKEGISNINYKIDTDEGQYVLRIPRENMIAIDFANQGKVLKKAKDLNFDVIYYNSENGIMISKFIKLKKELVSFNEVVTTLKQLHSLDITDIEDFDPFTNLYIYKNVIGKTMFDKEEVIISQAKLLYSKYDKVLCHNDLLYANFCKDDNRLYLIDYEYSGKNIVLFDLVSFLSENNINEMYHEQFYHLYFDKVSKDLKQDIFTMSLFLDILWGYWGYAMYEKYQEEVFLNIANEKKHRYHLKVTIF